MRHRRSHAFSLIELSIVMVILGLLAGGILSGQALIRAAEIRSYISDSQRYLAAMITFRDKYFATPGDMDNATRFWGTLAGTGSDATCQNTPATTQATCNGNGDGWVGDGAVQYDERFRFWQHLANAGLIEGRYSGRTDSNVSGSFITTRGLNVPALKANATATIVAHYTTTVANPGSFMFGGLPATNYLEFRGISTSTMPLKPEDVWNIDTKLDDGKPGYGIINGPQSSWAGSTNCTSSDDPATAQYVLTSNTMICRFNMRL